MKEQFHNDDLIGRSLIKGEVKIEPVRHNYHDSGDEGKLRRYGFK